MGYQESAKLQALLVGLECQKVDKFIKQATIKDCESLGMAYKSRVDEFIRGNEQLQAQLTQTKAKLDGILGELRSLLDRFETRGVVLDKIEQILKQHSDEEDADKVSFNAVTATKYLESQGVDVDKFVSRVMEEINKHKHSPNSEQKEG